MEQNANFRKRLRDLVTELKGAIEELVLEHKVIKIPYEYEELDENVQQLIDDGFVVEEGDPNNNFILPLENFVGEPLDTVIVGVSCGMNGVYIITDMEESFDLIHIDNVHCLINLHEVLECVIKGDMSWKM